MTLDDTLAKATDGLGDDLQPLDPAKVTPKVETSDPKVDEPAKEKEPKEDVGFTADELDDEPVVETKPEVTQPEISTDGMNPEQKYIVDNLPFITARIKSGNSFKEVQVKSWTQLPEDVEFASKRDEMAFVNALQAQENRALSLQSKFQQDTQMVQNKQFEAAENAMIQDDVVALQKENELPNFKVKMSDPKFAEDPATQEVQKVIDYMEDRNKHYLAEYQQGRPFRHIGFREAFYMYQRQHPTKSPAEAKEDTERKELAERLQGNRGLTPTGMKKATVRSGTRTEDILNRIEQEW